MRAVLPDIPVVPVGGVGPSNFASWWEAGARGFGLGSALYKPGATPRTVKALATGAVSAVRRLL